MRGLATVALFAAICVAAPAIGRAQTEGVNPLIGTAKHQIDQAEFEAARKTLQSALRDPDNTEASLVEIYRLLGVVNVYLNDRPAAERAFEELLRLSPDYQIPATAAAKVREIFNGVKTRVAKAHRATLKITPPPDAAAGQPARFVADVSGLQHGWHAVFYYRRPGDAEYRTDDLEKDSGGKWFVKVPATSLPLERQDYVLEWYAEILDASRLRVTAVGDALNPRRITVKSSIAAEENGGGPVVEPESPWYKKWWVWVIVGGVAVGAGATAYALSPSQPNTGTVPVQVKP